jgi:hypothetical protein
MSYDDAIRELAEATRGLLGPHLEEERRAALARWAAAYRAVRSALASARRAYYPGAAVLNAAADLR